MTYTLETININPNENLFFNPARIATPEQFDEFYNPIIEKYRNRLGIDIWATKENRTFQLPNGHWQHVTYFPGFERVADAVELFKDLTADGTEYRRIRRAWHQANGILAEANILDENGKVIDVIHACQAHKCIRFGTCPSQGSGCATVPEHTHDGIYPIYHVELTN